MAIWQVDLNLVCETAKRPAAPDNAWTPPLLPSDQAHQAWRFLSESLGEPWQMVGDWFVFGPENGSRVDVFFENADAAHLLLRFDVRNEGAQFITLACRLARKLACLFYSADTGAFIEPSEGPLAAAIDAAHNAAALRGLNMQLPPSGEA